MKINFVQSGGFVGQIRGCEIDTNIADPKLSSEIIKLVKASGISKSGEFLSNAGRDFHQYDIIIEDGNFKIIVCFDEETLPAAARPLVGYLKKHSTPQCP